MRTFRLAVGKTFLPLRIMICGDASTADGIAAPRIRAYVFQRVEEGSGEPHSVLRVLSPRTMEFQDDNR